MGEVKNLVIESNELAASLGMEGFNLSTANKDELQDYILRLTKLHFDTILGN